MPVVDWSKLAPVLRADPRTPVLREPERSEQLAFRMTPQMSLVARDWDESQSLFGRLEPTDQLRLSHSLRMVVARVSVGGGAISPFAQTAFGQWRVDTTVVRMRNDIELAGQVGGGVELHVAPNAAIAWEGDLTMLYRQSHEADAVPVTRLWATLLAAKGRF
jgi:hypothetical protein